jgi:hypothetical protein
MRNPGGMPYLSNGLMFIAAASGLALLGASVSSVIMWVGIVANIALVVCWALLPKFNSFMDNRIKVFKYIYFDSKNDPLSYALWALCMSCVIVWGFGEYREQQSLDLDAVFGFITLYIIFCVMVFVGYYKDYDRLP